MGTQIMNNQLDTLESMVYAKNLDLDLFYDISIQKRSIKLLGHCTKENIEQCERAIGGKLIPYEEHFNNGWLKGEIIFEIPVRKETYFYDTSIITFVLTPED